MLRKLIIGAVISASMSSMALAAGFVELGVGSGKLSGSGTDCDPTYSCKKTGTGYKLGGGYMFNENVGAEVSYYSMPNEKVTGGGLSGSGKTKTTGIGLGVLGAYPVAKDVKILGRLGLVDVTSKDSGSGDFAIPNGTTTSKKSTDLYWGVGASYDVSSNVDVSLNYERLGAKDTTNTKYTAGLFSVAAGYKF